MVIKTKDRVMVEIRDLWLAGALKSKGIHPERAEKNAEGYLNFFYRESEELRMYMEEAQEGKLLVNWKSFVTAVRDLKDLKYRT